MFDVFCPGHGTRVLLGPRSIDALVNTAAGVELHWTCRCGASGVQHPAAAPARHGHRTAA